MEVMRRTFEDYCGYHIYYKVLNSKDFGIPQHRERIFCIGFKEHTKFEFPIPIPLEYRMYDFLEDTIASKYFLREKVSNSSRQVKNRKKMLHAN